MNNKHTLKEKFEYWLEKKISKSSIGLIKIIVVITLSVAFIVALILTILQLSGEDGFFYTFWDTLASSINAWMPYSEDGDYNVTYVLLTAVASIVGLFVTSSLISIISSALEERITSIKKGNTQVLENDHIIILGFTPGEYTLIKQVVYSAGDKPLCVVVASDEDKEEMESLIDDNVNVPDNVKIICRSVDICSSTSLKCCSIDTCRSIIISPMEDETTIKCLYALSYLTKETGREDIVIVATIKEKEFMLPANFNNNKNIIMLVLFDFIGRIIAFTCTQPGLSLAYLELFNEKGSELYLMKLEGAVNKKFGELLNIMDGGVPIGVINGNKTTVDPGYDYVIKDDDQIVVFSEDTDTAFLTGNKIVKLKNKSIKANALINNLVILGYNETMPTIIKEMPDVGCKITFAGAQDDNYKQLKKLTRKYKNMKIIDEDVSIDDIDSLEKLVAKADRVMVLNNHNKEEESADVKAMLRLTKLRDIRNRMNLNYSIGVEIRKASSRTLVSMEDHTDYIVRSNIFSMFLAQLVKNPGLLGVYRELLTNEGKEIQVIPASSFDCLGKRTTSEIRSITYACGCIFMGYIKKGENDYEQHFNPSLLEELDIEDNDYFIVVRQ